MSTPECVAHGRQLASEQLERVRRRVQTRRGGATVVGLVKEQAVSCGVKRLGSVRMSLERSPLDDPRGSLRPRLPCEASRGRPGSHRGLCREGEHGASPGRFSARGSGAHGHRPASPRRICIPHGRTWRPLLRPSASIGNRAPARTSFWTMLKSLQIALKGDERIRTAVRGFAGLCLNHSATSPGEGIVALGIPMRKQAPASAAATLARGLVRLTRYDPARWCALRGTTGGRET